MWFDIGFLTFNYDLFSPYQSLFWKNTLNTLQLMWKWSKKFLTMRSCTGAKITGLSCWSWIMIQNSTQKCSSRTWGVRELRFILGVERSPGTVQKTIILQEETTDHDDVEERAWWTVEKLTYRGHSKNNWSAAENHAGDHWRWWWSNAILSIEQEGWEHRI